MNTQRFGQGNIDKAFGKMLKLNDGPERLNWCIETFYWRQKCPKYMKIFNAANIPQKIILIGII